jgi:FSR family fosmidomycin resistance protein-like MFS transporter
MRTLWLLSAAHAVNHAQAALLPLVYLAIIPEFGISAGAIALLAAAGNIAAGTLQLAYGAIARFASRRAVLAVGGLIFGGGMAAQAAAPNFTAFSIANIVSRLGATPQHPVGNGLLAEQFPAHRRGFAISAHIAGGNLGTLAIPLLGTWIILQAGWRPAVVLFGIPAIVIAVLVWTLVHETGADRAAARAQGSLRDAFGRIFRDRDLRWIFLASVIAGGGRGLGVTNVFVPLYLSLVLGFDAVTVGVMYTVLLIGSVPGPIVAGWLSDRVGRKPVIIGAYLAGAAAFVVFILAGRDPVGLWLGIVLMSAFNFVESPQLQALLADVAPPALRDVSFALYFTLAFGVGSLWTALYGALVEIQDEAVGIPLSFWLMAAGFVVAAAAVLPIHVPAQQRSQPVDG